jgi:hypothetical protein
MSWEVPAAATHLYLTVTAIPTTHRNYIWSQPYHPVGTITQKLEHFPYRVLMTGAVPARNEAEGDRTAPSGSAVRHINPDGSTGGWKTVSVPASAYIGYNAWVTGGSVSGNARIEDRATVTGGTVSGNAIIAGHATVTGGMVTDNAVVDDWAVVAGGTVRDFARLRDNAFVNTGTVRGEALVAGYGTIGTGVFDQGSASSGALVSGTTVIKGLGYVSGSPQMTGNAMVMASGIGSNDRVTTIGVQYNGEPSDQPGTNDELGLEDINFQNLFARYLFAAQDNSAVWDNFNTTWGWMGDMPATWTATSATGPGGSLTGALGFASSEQFVELSPELSDWRDWTIQLWTRWDGQGGPDQKLWEFARDADNYMYLQPDSSEGGVTFVIAVNGVVKTLRGADPLTPGEWQHVAITFSGDTARLYVNASAVATRTTVTMDPSQIRAASALLGRGVASGSGYHGQIDSLLVYSDARTAAEILTDVRAILGGSYTPAPDAPPDQDPSVLGDYTGDGSVDTADYVVWRKAFGQSVTPGTGADGNGDGHVDEGDYNLWRANFGRTKSAPAVATVAVVDIVFAEASAIPAEQFAAPPYGVDPPLTQPVLAKRDARDEGGVRRFARAAISSTKSHDDLLLTRLISERRLPISAATLIRSATAASAESASAMRGTHDDWSMPWDELAQFMAIQRVL